MSKGKKYQNRKVISAIPEMLTAADVVQIHEQLTVDFGLSPDPISPPGVKSEHLLESALSRQLTGHGETLKYHAPVYNAATLLYGIIANPTRPWVP